MATDKEQQLPPPALPWAHKDDEEEAEQHGDDSAAESGSDGSEDGEGSESEEEEAPLEALTAEEAGLKIGDRVEVRWAVQGRTMWWGATLAEAPPDADAAADAPAATSTEGEGADATAADATAGLPRYTLVYEPFEDFPVERHVTFLTGPHSLYHAGHGTLGWRRDGEAWEGSEQGPQDEGADPDAEPVEPVAYTFKEVADYCRRNPEAAGEGDRALQERLDTLDAYGQRVVLSGIDDWKTSFCAFVDQRAVAAGGPYTITPDDVREFNQIMLQKHAAKRARFS